MPSANTHCHIQCVQTLTALLRSDLTNVQIQDAAEFANEVLQGQPSVPAFIGGQSLGGLISAHVALRNQSSWSGMVLCSAAMNIEWTLSLRWVLPARSPHLLTQACHCHSC